MLNIFPLFLSQVCLIVNTVQGSLLPGDTHHHDHDHDHNHEHDNHHMPHDMHDHMHDPHMSHEHMPMVDRADVEPVFLSSTISSTTTTTTTSKPRRRNKNKRKKRPRKPKRIDNSVPFNFRIPRTSFSCKNRAPGYYSDMEADCTVYKKVIAKLVRTTQRFQLHL